MPNNNEPTDGGGSTGSADTANTGLGSDETSPFSTIEETLAAAGRVVQRGSRSFQARAESLMKDALASLGAASSIFSLPDRWPPRTMRLAAMAGVQLLEPMHGYEFPSSIRMKSVDGKAFCIIDYSVKGDDRGRIGKALSPIVSQAVIEQSVHAKLFGNFAHREGVKVAVWMRSEQAEEFGPELWINYNRAHSVTEIDLAAIRAVWKRLDRISVGLDAEAERKTKHWISQSIHILDSMVHLTPIGESLESYLDSILKGVQRAFDLESDEMVDVLLFRPGTRTLEVAKRFAPSLDHSVPREVDVPSLQGIASWVAVMGRALLVSNLQESAFRDLHIKVLGHTSSELTVPLLSGSELLGIINLESPRPNRFPPESVRPLWYAANQAAVAFRLVQQAEWTKRLLEIAHEATSSLPGPTTPSEAAVAHEKLLERLARLAREMLSGSECDIWHFNAREGHFK